MHKITKHIANVYDGDDFEDLKHLGADGHQIEIVNGWVFVNHCQVDGYWFMIDGPKKVRRFHKERWTMDDITERIALEDRERNSNARHH